MPRGTCRCHRRCYAKGTPRITSATVELGRVRALSAAWWSGISGRFEGYATRRVIRKVKDQWSGMKGRQGRAYVVRPLSERR